MGLTRGTGSTQNPAATMAADGTTVAKDRRATATARPALWLRDVTGLRTTGLDMPSRGGIVVDGVRRAGDRSIAERGRVSPSSPGDAGAAAVPCHARPRAGSSAAASEDDAPGP